MQLNTDTIVRNLGHCVGRAKINGTHSVWLEIFRPSISEDNVFTPPTHLSLYGIPEVVALRDLLNETITAAAAWTPERSEPYIPLKDRHPHIQNLSSTLNEII